MVATDDFRSGFNTSIGLGLAVVVGLTAVTALVVVSLLDEHHVALRANRQGGLPKIKA